MVTELARVVGTPYRPKRSALRVAEEPASYGQATPALTEQALEALRERLLGALQATEEALRRLRDRS